VVAYGRVLLKLALGGAQLSSPKSVATCGHNDAPLQQALACAAVGAHNAGRPMNGGDECGGGRAAVGGVQEARRVGGEHEPGVPEEEAPASAAAEEVAVRGGGGEMGAAASAAAAAG